MYIFSKCQVSIIMFIIIFKSVRVVHLSLYIISLGVQGLYTQAVHSVNECQSGNTQIVL